MSNQDVVTLNEAIEYLFELSQLDGFALGELVHARAPCNDELAAHPSVQVAEEEDGHCTVGIVGILNGLFGTLPDGRGKITFVLDEDEVINVRGTWPEETPWFEAAQE